MRLMAACVCREYALRPGTQAPLVGTLMEVVRALRCPDGRLIILALGVGRIRVRARLPGLTSARSLLQPCVQSPEA